MDFSPRLALVSEAFRLEWLTIAFVSIETVLGIVTGIVAGSLVLLAFGLDSVRASAREDVFRAC